MDESRKEESIPKIIHQMWLDKSIPDNTEPPEKYRKLGYPENIRKHNPEWKYILWNRKMVEDLIRNDPVLAKWKQFYFSKLGHWIEKCDFARYCILLIMGGVYLDLDFNCLKSLDPLLYLTVEQPYYSTLATSDNAFDSTTYENTSKTVSTGKPRQLGIVWEPKEHSTMWDGVPRRLYNGVLMSIKGHWFWPQLMDFIMKRYEYTRWPLSNTGPICFANFFRSHKKLLDKSEYFLNTCEIIPYNDKGMITQGCPPGCDRTAFMYTRWNEGTGWGVLTLEDENHGSTTDMKSATEPHRKAVVEQKTKKKLKKETTITSQSQCIVCNKVSNWTILVTVLLVLLIVILAMAVGFGVYFSLRNRTSSRNSMNSEDKNSNTQTTTSTNTSSVINIE